MARAWAGYDDIFIAGVVVDDKILIGGIGVHAYRGFIEAGVDI